jgi:hypothetical protein
MRQGQKKLGPAWGERGAAAGRVLHEATGRGVVAFDALSEGCRPRDERPLCERRRTTSVVWSRRRPEVACMARAADAPMPGLTRANRRTTIATSSTPRYGIWSLSARRAPQFQEPAETAEGQRPNLEGGQVRSSRDGAGRTDRPRARPRQLRGPQNGRADSARSHPVRAHLLRRRTPRRSLECRARRRPNHGRCPGSAPARSEAHVHRLDRSWTTTPPGGCGLDQELPPRARWQIPEHHPR